MKTDFFKRLKELYEEYIEAVDYTTDFYGDTRKDFFNMCKNIKVFFKRIFHIPFRKCVYFKDNLIRSTKWFIRMWNNPDYDHEYLIEMIVMKLKDMRYQFDVVDSYYVDLRHQPSNTLNSDSEETVDVLESLDRAIEIGERIIKNDYTHYTPEIDKWFEENDILSNNRMPDDLYEEFMKIHNDASDNELNDRIEFFNIIRDNHESWWS